MTAAQRVTGQTVRATLQEGMRLMDGVAPPASIRAVFSVLSAPPDIFDRVRRLQRDLAHHRGMWHRTPIPDLFLAETALSHNAGVLHRDRDYARIATVRPELLEREIT